VSELFGNPEQVSELSGNPEQLPHTPTTEEIRESYIYGVTGDVPWKTPEYQEEAEQLAEVMFDRWLTDVKAEAWSEGFDAGERDVFEHDRTGWDDSPCISNPYKGENK